MFTRFKTNGRKAVRGMWPSPVTIISPNENKVSCTDIVEMTDWLDFSESGVIVHLNRMNGFGLCLGLGKLV